MISTHLLGYSPMTDTTELPRVLVGLNQFLTTEPTRRHRAARRARKAGRVAFGTLAALGAAVTASVVAFGPSSLLDAADVVLAR